MTFSDLFAFQLLSKIKDTPFVSFDAINARLHIPLPIPSVGMVKNGWAEKAVSALLDKMNGTQMQTKELIDVQLYV